MKSADPEQQIREDLLAKASAGDMTPDEAEAEAARHGVGRLASCPDAEDFDAMAESYWTIPMAIAWIAFRKPDAVRHWWNAYREQCWDWRQCNYRADPAGPLRMGWILEQRRPATLPSLMISALIDAARDEESVMSPREAEEALWAALREDCFEATGISTTVGERMTIMPLQWHELTPIEAPGVRDEVRRGMLGEGFREVLLPSRPIVRFWPAEKPRLQLPQLMAPTGDGYMQLFCVAQWIATKGGALDFDPEDVNVWSDAYDALLRSIASDKVRVIGLRGGVYEPVPSYVFAACRVDYPYSNAPLDLMLADELYLRSYPYIDDEHWRKGFDDALINRREDRWTQLLVARSDVRTLWPFNIQPNLNSSGAPGRPTSMHLILAELDRRIQLGKLEVTLSAQADVLFDWLIEAHPHAVRPTAKTIKNRIGPILRSTRNIPK